ncbi:MAG: YicC/YloC family endoribonuclease [Rubricoccaceae bacterium]|nr:YicC/YloC family endoribonuclease [Rubricoccaceae bacterium]
MLRSMTGFGRGFHQADAIEATVEIRSVNGRFAEVSVRSPRELNAFDATIQSICKDRLTRGNIAVNITVLRGLAGNNQSVNTDRVNALMATLTELQEAAGLTTAPITIDHLLRYPDIFAVSERDPRETEQETWTVVQPALNTALDALDEMRLQEGEALYRDLSRRISFIESLLTEIEKRAPYRVDEAHEKLKTRLGDLLADDRLSAERLETEIALFADKLDVTEECVRLHSHIDQFREALDDKEAVGRRLNFIAQEFNREINTIASKANDAEVAQVAVRMKEELERVREQVQNVV